MDRGFYESSNGEKTCFCRRTSSRHRRFSESAWKSNVRSVEQVEEKKLIARKAIEYISDNDVIALTYGTTIFELAKLLTYKKNLTITVNDLTIASWLEQNTDYKKIYIRRFYQKRFPFRKLLRK
jgi:DeoR/GlpR family transcriptional regulator of sugar metabolism